MEFSSKLPVKSMTYIFLCELKISPQYNSLLLEIVRAYRFLSEWEYDFSPFNLLFLS